VVESATPGARKWLRVGGWMAAGGAQVLVYGPVGVVSKVLWPDRAPDRLARFYAGLGKLLWWTHPHVTGRRRNG